MIFSFSFGKPNDLNYYEIVEFEMLVEYTFHDWYEDKFFTFSNQTFNKPELNDVKPSIELNQDLEKYINLKFVDQLRKEIDLEYIHPKNILYFSDTSLHLISDQFFKTAKNHLSIYYRQKGKVVIFNPEFKNLYRKKKNINYVGKNKHRFVEFDKYYYLSLEKPRVLTAKESEELNIEKLKMDRVKIGYIPCATR